MWRCDMKNSISLTKKQSMDFWRWYCTLSSLFKCGTMLLLLVFLASCSSVSSSEKSRLTVSGVEPNTAKTASVEAPAPEPGDIKVIDGVEFIYASNRRYMFTPYEPLNVWIRKDEYTPRMGENLLTRNAEETEHFRKLEERIKRLEEELKKMDAS
jgi:hypothetical protein